MLRLRFLLIAVSLFMTARALSATLTVGILPAEFSTSKNTSYVFEFIVGNILSGNISTGSYFTVTFPTDYPLNTLMSGLTGPGVNDSVFTVDPSVLTLSSSGRTFKINGAFPFDWADDFMMQFTISGIVNPNRVKTTGVFIMSLYDSEGVLQLTNNSQTMTTTAGILTCSMVPTNTEVEMWSPYTITITPTTTIPFDGQILMVFPSYWPKDQIKDNTVLPSRINCVGLGTTSLGLKCQMDGVDVTVTNLFNSNTSSQFEFKIEAISNPTTTQPVGTVTISSYDSSLQQIDQCSATVTGVTPTILAQASFSVASITVNSQSVGTLKFTTSKVLQVGDRLQVIFPTAFTLSKLTSYTMVVGSNISSATIDSHESNIITITIPITSSLPAAVVTFNFTKVIVPPSTLTTENFQISTLRNGFPVESTTCCSFTATTGTLTVSIQAGNYKAGANTNYNFTITTSNLLLSTATVEIIFPEEYILASSSGLCVSGSGTNVSATQTCTIQTPRTLTISNFLTSSLSGGQTFSITVGSITNPSEALTSSYFKISTIYSSSGGYSDINSNQQVTIQPSAIQSVTLTTSNAINNQPANYTFTINNTNALSSGSFLQIVVPSSITVGSISCFVLSAPVTCSIVSTNTINVTNHINSSVAAGVLTSIPLVIVGLTNPINFQPTNSFSVKIFTSSYVIIQSLSTGIIVTMTASAPFSSVTITPASMLTGTSTTYSIQISTPFTLGNNTNLTITFPAELTVTGQTCTAVNHLTTVDCTLSTQPVTMLLPLTSLTANYVKFNLTTVINPISLATPGSISVSLYVSGYLSLVSSVVLGPFTPNSITYSATQTSNFMAETTNIAFAITTTNNIPPIRYLSSEGYLTITIPAEYGISSLTCGPITGISASSCTINSNVVKITGTSFQTSITVDLQSLINPSVDSSSTFIIKSYDSLNNLIDISLSNYKFSLLCTLPCRNCTTTLNSCLSCYTQSTLQSIISNRQYLTQSTCATSCNTSAYSDSSMICHACSTSCKTCSVAQDNCTSCPATLPYFLNNTCYSTCPNGYYSNSSLQTCQQCINNCKTCSSVTLCLSCNTGYYMNNTSCISSCPPLTYNLSGVCTNCSTNCISCDNSGCLNCQTGYLLHVGSCLLNCPTGFFIRGTVCTSCNTSCLTCLIYADTCASCLTTGGNKYLYFGSCLTECPAGYYASNFNCVSCVGPCLQCTSLTGCTKCVIGQLLYENNCAYSTCPGSTIQIGSTCQDCTSPCLTCNVSQTYCLTCITNYFLENYTCVATCSAGLFGINGKCLACAEPCLLCVANKPTNCTSCIADYFLNGSTCFSTCPTGTYTSYNEGKCQPCSSSCQTCTNSTNCTSCVQGLFLFNFFCYNSCPTSPILYYAYERQCLTCQPQCSSCISSPVECVACSSSQYLYNIVTKTCAFSCDTDYYQNGSQCIACQPPCLTCDTVFNSCASCFPGQYLFQGTCIHYCPTGYYNSLLGRCVQCIFPCVQCTNTTCLKCDSTGSYYDGNCYFTCPSNVPYSVNGFCTNCQGFSYCLSCGQKQCNQCIAPYFKYQGQCVKTCPINYESDPTGTYCQMTATYLAYLDSIEQDRRRNLPFPFVILFLGFTISLIVSHCQNKPTYYIGSIITFAGLLQFFSWILFLVFLLNYSSAVVWLPYLVAALFGVNLLFNFLNLIPIIVVFRQDYNYKEWLSQGNQWKQKLIIATSIITSFKFSRAIFCRYFDVDAFSSRLLAVDKFYWWNCLTWASFFFVEGLAIATAMLVAFNEPAFYTKLFFASIEVLFFSGLEICAQLADLRKDEHRFFRQEEDDPLLDDPKAKVGPQWGDQEAPKLKYTRSLPKLNPEKTEYELADDYISVYDPSDYQDVPKMINTKIPRGIQKGKFRKKNKKKLENLWSIAEISDDDDDGKNKNKKQHGNGPVGFINNYIYWKPPKIQKVKPKAKISKQKPLQLSQIDQQMIFETIRNKQSQFDMLSKHEDFFAEKRAQPARYGGKYEQLEVDGSKLSIDISMSQDMLADHNNSNNLIFDPDDLLNLNYARKKHIEKKNESIFVSDSQTKRPLSKVAGVILKNTKKR